MDAEMNAYSAFAKATYNRKISLHLQYVKYEKTLLIYSSIMCTCTSVYIFIKNKNTTYKMK